MCRNRWLMGGGIAGGMRIGCWFVGWSRGSCRRRLGDVLFLKVDDGGGEGPLFRKNSQAEGGDHEDDGDHDREFAEKVRRSAASEHRLAGTAKCRTDFRAFARLQENGTDHKEACDDVNDDDKCVHRDLD